MERGETVNQRDPLSPGVKFHYAAEKNIVKLREGELLELKSNAGLFQRKKPFVQIRSGKRAYF